MNFDIKKFDEYRENNRLEVKKAKGGLPNSLWDTYSSMCNTFGGCIILGVIEHEDHTWETCGLKDASKLKKDFWDTINNNTKVSVNLLQETDVVDYEHSGDVILVIKVPHASRENKPVYINDDIFGGTFKRNWEGDYHCVKREVLAMLRDQAEDTSDMKVLGDFSIDDFDYDSIHEYRRRYDLRHENGAWTKLSDEEFLVRLGAAKRVEKKIYPTAAGLLMFGQEYQIVYEYPEYFLDYREKLNPDIRWTDRVHTQSGDWSGNIFDFFCTVYPKITAELKKPFYTEGSVRMEEGPLHLAVREAIANCLVNADFFQPWSVVIEKYSDRIELANPGLPRIDKEQMMIGGISEPRNKNLLKMFNQIGIGERAGSGVPEIFDIWKNEGLKNPEIREQYGPDKPDRTIVVMPLEYINRAGSVSDSILHSAKDMDLTLEQLANILSFCNEPRTRKELQEFCGYKSPSHFREKILVPLIEGEQLVLTIPEKPNSPKQKYVRKIVGKA